MIYWKKFTVWILKNIAIFNICQVRSMPIIFKILILTDIDIPPINHLSLIYCIFFKNIIVQVTLISIKLQVPTRWPPNRRTVHYLQYMSPTASAQVHRSTSVVKPLTVWMYSKWPPSCWVLSGWLLSSQRKDTSSEGSWVTLQLSTTLSPTVTSTRMGLNSTRMGSETWTSFSHQHIWYLQLCQKLWIQLLFGKQMNY